MQWCRKHVAWGLLILGVNWSCGKAPQNSDAVASLKEHWDYHNDPTKIGLVNNHYEASFDRLPLAGSLTFKPWSDSYWPSYLGGTSYRWNLPSTRAEDRVFYNLLPDFPSTQEIKLLSPAEKYDIFIGDPNFGITRSERHRTEVMKRLHDVEIPRWFGICHAWSAAALSFREPGPVMLQNSQGISVPFGASDVKALLSLFLNYESGQSFVVSRRCHIDDKALKRRLDRGEISTAEFLTAMETADCKGINAGAFHIVVSNLIGLRNEGFIADLTRGSEVWNQPVHGFKTRILETRRGQLSAEAAPGTVEELRVETSMIYVLESSPSWYRFQEGQGEKLIKYVYWLELDARRKIIGGHWEGYERPDFLWKRTIPEFAGVWKPLGEIYHHAINDLSSPTPSEGTSGIPDASVASSEIKVAMTITQAAMRRKLELNGTFPPGVVQGYIEIRDRHGDLNKVFEVPVGEDGKFNFKGTAWAWYGTHMILAGYDKDSRKVSEIYRSLKE